MARARKVRTCLSHPICEAGMVLVFLSMILRR